MRWRKNYLAETEADTLEQAQANFADDGAEFGPSVEFVEDSAIYRVEELPEWTGRTG